MTAGQRIADWPGAGVAGRPAVVGQAGGGPSASGEAGGGLSAGGEAGGGLSAGGEAGGGLSAGGEAGGGPSAGGEAGGGRPGTGRPGTGRPGTGLATAEGAAPAEAAAAAAFLRRAEPLTGLAGQAADVAAAAHAMAVRFHRGGKLLAFGEGAASTDAQHIAVEFIHPVIVGKRALPALTLTADVATVTAVAAREGTARTFAYQVEQLGRPADIALGISRDGDCESVLDGLLAASERGMLTVALAGGADGTGGAIGASLVADHLLVAASADPLVVKELQVTAYHILWELVHVFFEQPSVLGPGVAG